MKTGFYPRLALDGIRKNRRIYLPYLLTCIGMVMMYYILLFLTGCNAVKDMPGSGNILAILSLGTWVVALFAVIFLFYTNSFLIRRRKSEFGLYNILGMSRRNIARILFWETLLLYAASLVIGLMFGIALSKFAELGLVNMLRGDVSYSLSVSPRAIAVTAVLFAAIFLLLYLNALRQVRFSSAIQLMRSDRTGEKPPRGNRVLGLLGVLCLGTAYFLAASIDDAITALSLFFVAVILVIIGTYLLMIAGSVLFCRLLQKNKRYYYRPNHFVSVSSMVYRMKRNGAGLASICILATMVLVMISSTSCLYFGTEDGLDNRYPRDIDLTLQVGADQSADTLPIDSTRAAIDSMLTAHGGSAGNVQDYRYLSFSGTLSNGTIDPHMDYLTLDNYSIAALIHILPLADYNALMGTSETLSADEALVFAHRTTYTADTVRFADGAGFRVKQVLRDFITDGESAMNAIPTVTVIVNDPDAALPHAGALRGDRDNALVKRCWTYNFDTALDTDAQSRLYDDMYAFLKGQIADTPERPIYLSLDCRDLARSDFYGTFGSLFYLGIILSLVFLIAAVLIIYYKQISEGYEDQARFDIMQKVGMTRRDIRRSINSQLLTVFFLPLAFAGLHLAFAFPMIRQILFAFNLMNVGLFATTTLISFLAFSAFYALVYRITSNAYYRIVSA